MDPEQPRRCSSRLRERDKVAAEKYLEELEKGIPPPSPVSSPSSPTQSHTNPLHEASSQHSTTSHDRQGPSLRSLNFASSNTSRLSDSAPTHRQKSIRRKSSGESDSTPAVATTGGAKGELLAKKESQETPLKYGLWAHYLAYGAAIMSICMGMFAVVW